MKNLQENPTSSQLLKEAQYALTPEQYERLKKRALEKMNVLEIASMNLDELKAQLPGIISGDPEEHDIMSRLDSVFPWVDKKSQDSIANKEPHIKFTEHPWKYVKQQTNDITEWMYEKLVPERFQEAQKAQNKWSSTKVLVATVLWGTTAWETVASVERAMNWLDKLKKDPIAWFKELFNTLLSFDIKKISAFFSSTIDDIWISSDTLNKFAEKWLPTSLFKSAKSIFSIPSFINMEFGKVEKIWKDYQKDNNPELLLKLWIPKEHLEWALPLLEKLFSKSSKKSMSQSFDSGLDIADMKIQDIIKQTVS